MKRKVITKSNTVFCLNKNDTFIKNMEKLLKCKNGHCPKKESSIDTICPCKDLYENDECICNLYIKEK